jgi:hypothetical protein
MIRTHSLRLLILAGAVASALHGTAALGQVDAVGDEFRVNSYTSGQQILPRVTHTESGQFVVVWTSYGPDESSGAVVAQRFTADAATAGKEFVVNTYTTSGQTQPSVGADAQGRFVVVWTSTPAQDGGGVGVFGQRFTANGGRRGDEFQVNAHTTGGQQNPDIAVMADGSFVTVWRDSSSRDGQGSGIYARRFDTDGDPIGNDFRVNNQTLRDQVFPSIATEGDGSFVVVFASYGGDDPADPTQAGVLARRYGADGQALGDEFVVNSYTTGMQTAPDVGVQPGGGFVVVWHDDEQFPKSSIVGQLYDAAGTPGGEFVVKSDATSTREHPRVAVGGDGSFIVAWESGPQDGSSRGTYARRFSAVGAPLGGEFQVNSFTAGSQYDVAISDDGQGNIAMVWQSPQDGSADGVYGQLFVATAGSDANCGDPIAITGGFESGIQQGRAVTATDALAALQAAVGLFPCPLCVCDVNGSGLVSASDALSILSFSVGQATSLLCPPCN